MRIIPSFVGLVKTGLARSSHLARLGGASRGRWSGVLSRHPLTTSAWGLARWSPAALSSRLAGWAMRQPWGGGWADMVYGRRPARGRRSSRTMRSADRSVADFTATSPLMEAEGGAERLAWPAWLADEGGTEAEARLNLDEAWPMTPPDALAAEPPVERLVATSLQRAYQMAGIARSDLRFTSPTRTLPGLIPSGREAAEAATRLVSASRATVERVVRRAPAETGLASGASGARWVEPGRHPVTLSTPLTPASAERLWQPAAPVRAAQTPSTLPLPGESFTPAPITSRWLGNLGEVGATPGLPERLLGAASGERPPVTGEASAPLGETSDQGIPGGRPATVILSGPPSPTRLWQAPTLRLTRSRLTPPLFAGTEAGARSIPGASAQRQVEPEGGAFVAPLHPARLWRPPAQARETASGAVWSEPAAAGLVYRQARSGRETSARPAPAMETGLPLRPSDMAGIAQAASASPGLPPLAFAATPSPARDAGEADRGAQAAPSQSDFAPRHGASVSGSSATRTLQRQPAGLWPLGEPMTTTGRTMLTGVGTARGQRPAEGSRESATLPTLLTPRRPQTVRRAASPTAEGSTPADANVVSGWLAGTTAPRTFPSASAALVGGGTAGARSSQGVSPDAASVQPHPDWPVLARLGSLAAPAAAPEPAAFQALRRLAPARAQAALTALASLPTLGAGEPLREEVRRPMETLTRRDLAGVRLHTSPVAETLGAEAFTSGQQVVFAPGRLNLRTPQGMALLGHELSHVGQPLAFKLTSGGNPPSDDAEEQAAGQQEDVIRRVVEQGWPEGSRREVRQASRALSAMMEHGGLAQPPGPGGPPAPGAPGAAPSGDGAASGGGGDGAAPVATARLSEAPQAGGAAPAAPPNVEALAKQVYSILKDRLRAERERHHVYDR